MTDHSIDKVSVETLVEHIERGRLALPNFQRSFVWESRQTNKLLASLAMKYPAGSLLFLNYPLLRNVGQELPFRPVDTAPDVGALGPEVLVLDGQQRITALYMALAGTGDYRYFVDLDAALDGSKEREDWFVAYQMNAKNQVLQNQATQIERRLLPTTCLRDSTLFMRWRDAFQAARTDETAALAELLDELWEGYFRHIREHQFPVVTLGAVDGLEPVCAIFETLNSTVIQLGPFELLTARFFPHGVSLRDFWEKALDDSPILRQFGLDRDPVLESLRYAILQALALRSRAGCKRSDILALKATDVEKYWDEVIAGFAEVLDLLRGEMGVVTSRWLPYEPILAPMAAVWHNVSKPNGTFSVARRKAMVRAWFWRSVFGQRYDSSGNSQAAKDRKELDEWLRGGVAPESFSSFSLEQLNPKGVTHRQRPVYRGLLALLIAKGAKDLTSGKALTGNLMANEGIEDHHVFPKGYVDDNLGSVSRESRDCVANRALISAKLNRAVGRKPPSHYVDELLSSNAGVAELFATQAIDSRCFEALRSDRFDDFLERRAQLLTSLANEACSLD